MTQQQPGRVAIIDDDPAVRNSLAFLLRLAGFVTDTYESAAAFLQPQACRPVCLILDQHMPCMTGLELAAQLRGQGIAIPILLVTGAPNPGITARARELGIEGVLDKPPAETDLLQFVARHNGALPGGYGA